MRTWNQSFSGYNHNLVGVRFKTKGTIFKAETFEYRDTKNITPEQFQEAWDAADPSEIFLEKEDASEAVKIWEHKLKMTLDSVAPVQRRTTKPRSPAWLTRELKELCAERDLRKKEADLWGTREAKTRYKKYRNYVTGKLKKAKFEWHKDNLTVDESKKWWSRVKKLAGLVKVQGEDMTIKDDDGTEISKPASLGPHRLRLGLPLLMRFGRRRLAIIR